MNFVADESVDLPIVQRLRQDGHLVTAIAELAPGMDDHAVLSIAEREGALLLTADKDFGELVYRVGLHTHGIVLVRLAGLPAAKKAEFVSLAARHHLTELSGAFTVVTHGMVRIRRSSHALE
jgi:predicted nuclease of predicted toxin-antitoxin system